MVVENCFPGNAGWGLKSAGPVSAGGIEGFATAQSINKGQSVDLKVNSSNSTTFNVEIYRTGYYGGAGARLMSTMRSIPGTAQPGCTSNDSTGLYDCSALERLDLGQHDRVAGRPGMYVLRIVRNDNSNDNLILLAVRDDARHPDLLYGSSFTTFQAYNNYGGRSLYDFNSCCGNTVTNAPRAAKVSFDRPFNQTLDGQRDWYTKSEIATVYWLEQEGYDVGVRLEHRPRAAPRARPQREGLHLAGARRVLVGGMHDNLVTGPRRRGEHLLHRLERGLLEDPLRAVARRRAGREQVRYKSTQSGGADPSGIPTGTWRDPAGLNQPENAPQRRDVRRRPRLRRASRSSSARRRAPTASGATRASTRWRRNVDRRSARTSSGWEWDARVANGAEPPGVEDARGLAGHRQPDPELRRSYNQNRARPSRRWSSTRPPAARSSSPPARTSGTAASAMNAVERG